MDWLREIALRRRALVPFDYPFTVPVVMYTGTLLVTGTAAVQRDFSRPVLLAVASVLAITPIFSFMCIGVKLSPLASAACSLTAVTLLLSWPPVFNDAAPFLLMFMLGEVFALSSARVGLAVFAVSAALLITASQTGHLSTFVPYLLFFLTIGGMMGRILQLQQRLVLQERERQAHYAGQAAADERRRIAREVHDVIAHSLSVTMLHLTGARRALQEDHDVAEAVDALLDAEQLGRQAMSDIRRTVGLLGAGDAKRMQLTPEPEMSDIPDLVESFAAAGLQVDARIEGASENVTAAIGLALYRVTQESLANIAKHAPDAPVQLRLYLDTRRAALSIHNELRTPVPTSATGAGLPGMRQRIEMLDGAFHAGPGPHGWTVHAQVPLPSVTPQSCGGFRNLLPRNAIQHD